MNGLQVGLCYWQTGRGKGSLGGELHVDIYFKNTGDVPLHLMRPHSALTERFDQPDPQVGVLFVSSTGQRSSAPVLTLPRGKKPTLLILEPHTTYHEWGLIDLPDASGWDHWPSHLRKIGPVTGDQYRTTSLRSEGQLWFVYGNDQQRRQCWILGPNPGESTVNEMWLGRAASGGASVFLIDGYPRSVEVMDDEGPDTDAIPDVLNVVK